jgi:hypothetical protein
MRNLFTFKARKNAVTTGEGEMWYYPNPKSIDLYVAPVSGRAATCTFRVTQKRLEKMLAEMKRTKRG